MAKGKKRSQSLVTNLIKHVLDDKYSDANNILEEIVESNIRKRIKKASQNTDLFKNNS